MSVFRTDHDVLVAAARVLLRGRVSAARIPLLYGRNLIPNQKDTEKEAGEVVEANYCVVHRRIHVALHIHHEYQISESEELWQVFDRGPSPDKKKRTNLAETDVK